MPPFPPIALQSVTLQVDRKMARSGAKAVRAWASPEGAAVALDDVKALRQAVSNVRAKSRRSGALWGLRTSD